MKCQRCGQHSTFHSPLCGVCKRDVLSRLSFRDRRMHETGRESVSVFDRRTHRSRETGTRQWNANIDGPEWATS